MVALEDGLVELFGELDLDDEAEDGLDEVEEDEDGGEFDELDDEGGSVVVVVVLVVEEELDLAVELVLALLRVGGVAHLGSVGAVVEVETGLHISIAFNIILRNFMDFDPHVIWNLSVDCHGVVVLVATLDGEFHDLARLLVVLELEPMLDHHEQWVGDVTAL